jgi:tetratricopeptide (TPR) repeat protein
MNMKRMICLVCLLGVSLNLLAAPTLPRLVYQKLQEAHSLMETESWEEAQDLLEKLSTDTKHKYAQALIAQNLGQISIHQDNIALALSYFQKALDLKVLDEISNRRLLHSISQLHCSIEEWVLCREKMQQWIKVSPDKVKATDYIILAQAYAATETWQEVVRPARSALELNGKAPKSWHQMLVVAHNNLEQWPEAIAAQQLLLQSYADESEEWRRLVSLHLSQGDSLAALNSMRLPYEKGLLTKGTDVKQLTLLLHHAELPYQASETLSEGLDNGWIDRNEKNLKLLASLWFEAKSFDKAIATYQQLVEIAPRRRWYKQLASLYFQEKNWHSAIAVIKEATESEQFQLDKPEQTNFELMLGMALINMNQLVEAKEILEGLANRESVKAQAENWLSYIEQVQNV